MLISALLCLGACQALPHPKAAPSQATAPAEQERDLETERAAALKRLGIELEAQRVATHVPGMAIAVVSGDQVIYAQGFGLADRESERPVDPETIFAIGSSTKAFTSTCIGILMDEGAMEWDDPIVKHLPEFRLQLDGGDEEAPDSEPLGPEAVTLRDLLAHRTGFTRMGILWAGAVADRSTILETATRAEAWSPFREAFFYNNVMYLAAGEASAVAADQTWEELVTTRLLTPLGMHASTTGIDGLKDDSHLALGYKWNEDLEAFERDPMRDLRSIAPAGSINSNVLDMAQWLRLQLGHGTIDGTRLISEERLEDTWEPQISIAPTVQYGLGWMLESWDGKRVVQHGGNIDGFSAMVALMPDDDLGFVLLTNASSTILQETCRSIVWNALLGPQPDDAAEPVAQSEEASLSLEEYTGTFVANYAHFEDEEFEVLVGEAGLSIDIPSQMVFALQAPDEAGHWPFAIQPEGIQASFERDESGAVVQLLLHQNGLTFEVPRKGYERPADGAAADFESYFGDYEHPALGANLTIKFEGGRLVCDIPGQTTFDLRLPNEEGLWSFRATDQIALEFHTDETGQVQSLTFHERGTETECPLVSRPEPDAQTDPLPTLEQLMTLRRSDAVAERFAKLGSIRAAGTIQFVHSGVTGSNVDFLRPDGAFLNEAEFPPFGWTRVAFDGQAKGWTESAFEAFDLAEGKQLTQLKLAQFGILFNDWRLAFDEIEVRGRETLDERRCLLVRLRAGELPAWTAYVDEETGDTLRIDARIELPGIGVVPQTFGFSDYREVSGLRCPFRFTAETDLGGRVDIRYESIEAGIPIPEDAFTPQPR